MPLYAMYFVEPRDVLAAVSSSKLLRNAALKKFNCIQFSQRTIDSFKPEKGAMALCFQDFSLLAALLDTFSGNLRKLTVHDNRSLRVKCIEHPWTGVLLRDVRPITELALYDL